MNKKIIEILNDPKDLNFEVNNEVVIVNFFCDNLKSMDINIIQNNDSEFILNYASINKANVNINVNSLVSGNNNKLTLNIKCVNEKNVANFNVKAKANKGTLNNEIIENCKGIIDSGSISFIPILEVDTKETNASHFATVGKVPKEKLFYLQSKGLSYLSAKQILKSAFLYNMFSEEFQNKIRK